MIFTVIFHWNKVPHPKSMKDIGRRTSQMRFVPRVDDLVSFDGTESLRVDYVTYNPDDANDSPRIDVTLKPL